MMLPKGHCPSQAPPFSLQGNNHELFSKDLKKNRETNIQRSYRLNVLTIKKQNEYTSFKILFFVSFLKLSLTKLPWLAWNLLC